jgi:ADP-ribose pyrophosphatase
VSSFRVTGSSRVVTAGFLAIDELSVVGPDGDEARRVVVRHPGAVVVVPVTDGGATALLVRQYRAATGQDLLEVPAGKRDVEGEPPAETARRELEEEIGFTPGRLVKLAEFFNTPGFCDEYTHLYAALDLVDAGGPRSTSMEERHMTVEPVAFADVDRLVGERRLIDAKSIIGLLLAREYLEGRHPALEE